MDLIEGRERASADRLIGSIARYRLCVRRGELREKHREKCSQIELVARIPRFPMLQVGAGMIVEHRYSGQLCRGYQSGRGGIGHILG